MGAITSFKAVKANIFETVFDGAIPEGTTLTITKDNVEQAGDWKYSDDRKTATFTGKAEFSKGEYVITAKTGSGEPLTAKTSVTDRKATSIVLLSNDTDKPALTNPEKEGIKDSEGYVRKANTQAYIYYEVRDQYNEKMDDSTDITWTISSSTSYTTDTGAGRITIQKSKDGYGQSAYTYGDLIHVYGVYSDRDNPIVVEGNVKIGTVQATDKVEAAGFINDKLEKKEIVKSLPKKFAKDTWYMVYQTYDQNGHLMEPVKYEDDDITMVPDALSSFKISVPTENVGGKIYNIDKKKYASVKVQPSTQTDRGGKVTLTAISKKTGKTSPYEFEIAKAAVLKSIDILGPKEGVIADGDTDRELSYRALDVDGKETRDYETIVRSSNVLSLAASEGLLKVSEDAKGEAVITWTDTEKDATDFESASAKDNTDRRVALTTVVSGGAGDGETKVSIISVKDTRRPVAFKNIKWGTDENGALVIGQDYKLEFLSDKVEYVDQYGNILRGGDARTKAFFSRAMNQGFNKEKYAIKVETDNNTELAIADKGLNGIKDATDAKDTVARGEAGSSEYLLFNWEDGVKSADDSKINARIVNNQDYIMFKAHDKYEGESATGNNATKTLEYNKLVDNISVTYSIVSVKETEVTSGNLQQGKDFTRVNENMSSGYSVVPSTAIRDNVSIELNNPTGKYFVYTDNTENANGTYIKSDDGLKGTVKNGDSEELAIGGANDSLEQIVGKKVISDNNVGVKVYGTTRSGLKCTLPSEYYEVSDESDIKLNKKGYEASDEGGLKITAVTGGALTWNQLYNDNDARMQRITANKTLAIKVKTTKLEDNSETEYKKNMVTQNIKLSDEIPYPASTDYKPETRIERTELIYDTVDAKNDNNEYKFKVFDQYGEILDKDNLAYTYSVDVTKENTDEDKTHLLNSFTRYGNGTSDLSASGVEIGDEFNMTVGITYNSGNFKGLGFTTQPYKLVAPADNAAYIASADIKDKDDKDKVLVSMNSDKDWRESEIINGGLGMKK